MAMRNLLVVLVLVLVWLAPLVAADYNCSGRDARVTLSYVDDFTKTFERAAVVVKAFGNYTLKVTATSQISGRKVSVWNVCRAESRGRRECRDCLAVVMKDLRTVCVDQRASWGGMNLAEECSITYNASDFQIQGWDDLRYNAPQTDVDGFLQPVSVDADAAHTVFPANKLYSISFPALLFNTFFGMYLY